MKKIKFCFICSFIFFSSLSYSKNHINLKFHDVELRYLLYIIAEHIDKNIIVSDTINDKVSINLSNISANSIFNFILDKNNLGFIEYDNLLYIEKLDNIQNINNIRIENNKISQSLKPKSITGIKINNKEAKDIYNLLTENFTQLSSTEGKIFCDKNSNTIFLFDNDQNVKKIKNFIKKLDKPVQQVVIEIKIVNTNYEFREEIGARLHLNNSRLTNSGKFAQINPNQNNFNMQNIYKISNNFLLNFEIDALEKENKLSIVASPTLLIIDKKKAFIESGKEIPYIANSGNGRDPQVIFKKATLKLEATPFITSNNQILLKLNVNKDQPGVQVAGISQAPIDTTNINTEILTKSGETIVLGGIFTEKKVVSISKIPILGDLPVFDKIFKFEKNVTDKSETIIFVTPRISRSEDI